MVNTIFSSHLVESKGINAKTTEISTETNGIHDLQVLQENGVKLVVSITDTPGFGDQVNNDNWYSILTSWEPIAKHIKDQYSLFLRKELFA